MSWSEARFLVWVIRINHDRNIILVIFVDLWKCIGFMIIIINSGGKFCPPMRSFFIASTSVWGLLSFGGSSRFPSSLSSSGSSENSSSLLLLGTLKISDRENVFSAFVPSLWNSELVWTSHTPMRSAFLRLGLTFDAWPMNPSFSAAILSERWK